MDNLTIMRHNRQATLAVGHPENALRSVGSFHIQALGESAVDHGWSTNDQPPYRTLGHSVFQIVTGSCSIWLGGLWWELRPGALYLIPGHQLISRRTSGMRHRVINFTLENFSTDRHLGQCKQVLTAPLVSHLPWAEAIADVSFLAREDLARAEHVVIATRIKSLLLGVTARMLERCGPQKKPCNELVDSAIAWLDHQYCRMPTLSELARHLKHSSSHVHARFTAVCGCSPAAYAEQRRLSDAQHLLCSTSLPINQVAQRCGYEDQFHFSRVVRRQLGSSPTQIRMRERMKAEG